MFYFCIFYIIPCLLNAWFANREYSNGNIDSDNKFISVNSKYKGVFL